MQIIVHNTPLCIKSGSSFDFIAENRLFSGSDGFSMQITFPLKDCPANTAVFGRIYRPDVWAGKVHFDCELRASGFHRFGCLAIVGISDSEVTAQFLEGRAEQNFDFTLDDVYINELDLGKPLTIRPADVDPAEALFSSGPDSCEAIPLPWANNSSGLMQNKLKFENHRYLWHEDCKELSWCPWLVEITERIAAAIGYSLDLSQWRNDEALSRLLMCNALPAAWGVREYARALPHWTVPEYFEKLELLLGAEFELDHRAKSISFRFTRDVLTSLPEVVIDNIDDSFSAELKEEDDTSCDYIQAKSLKYADGGHTMSKFYDCSWFIHQRGADIVSFSTLQEFNRGTSALHSWDGSSKRGYANNEVFYIAEHDTYVVFRALDKKLVKEYPDRPNVYVYNCVPQIINNFGGYIARPDDEDSDASEIEFLPVCIDYCGQEEGWCMMLTPGSFSEDTDTTSQAFSWGHTLDDYKQWRDEQFFQCAPVQALEAGEKEDASEYYSNIFVAYWTPWLLQTTGKTPIPTTDFIYFGIDGESYLLSEGSEYSLRLDADTFKKRGIQAIDTSRKYSFKFICKQVPNPRSIFIIRGKRYLCEKLTLTFTEKDRSQLIKGDFWPIPED